MQAGDSDYNAGMVSLSTPKHFRTVQDLPFCYLCGKGFEPGEKPDRDHVPARKAFHVRDRDKGPVLWLPTHWNCNNGHSEVDKKIGQLIGLRWGKVTSDRKLELTWYGPGRVAVTNLNIQAVVLGWVAAFHAALYREPLLLESITAMSTTTAAIEEILGGLTDRVPSVLR